ncbi:putative quinol monooxygenase [Streptomyces sp. NPDC002623]
MISIVTKWWHVEGRREEAITALKELVLQTEKYEPDTYMYCLHTSIVEGSLPPPSENEIIFLGAWKDRQAFDDHRVGPVFTNWLAQHLDLFVLNGGKLYVSAEFADRFAGFVRQEAIGG